jgi:hypothetical protein
MQQVLLLFSLIQQSFDEEPRYLVDLEETSLLQHICGGKVSGFAGYTAIGNGQRAPQRLKPVYSKTLPQA